MTTNQINYWNLLRQTRSDSEVARSNRAQEALQRERNAETLRSNLANERINRLNAETRRGELSENERSNRQREFETSRSNRANEMINQARNTNQYLQVSEQGRSNRASESNIRQKNLIDSMANFITSQRNQQSYNLGLLSNQRDVERNEIQQRYNQNQIANQTKLANEQLRSNLVQERLQAERNAISKSQNELGLQSLQETIRHNQTQEYINAFTSAFKLGLGAVRKGVVL